MAGKRTGKATVTINGVFIDTFNGVTVDPGGVGRTPVESDHSTGYSEQRKSSVVEFERTLTSDSNIKDLDLVDAHISVKWDTGQTHSITGAFCNDPPTWGDGGKSKVKFTGNPAKQL